MRSALRLWGLWVVFGALGCAPVTPADCFSQYAPSPTEAAYLSTLRDTHQAADLAELHHNNEAAQTLLQKALALPRPAGELARASYLDLVARDAQLSLQQGEPEEALASIQKAEQAAPVPDFYGGVLQSLSGEIYQQRAQTLERRGDLAGAAREYTAAIKAFQRAASLHLQALQSINQRSQGSSP